MQGWLCLVLAWEVQGCYLISEAQGADGLVLVTVDSRMGGCGGQNVSCCLGSLRRRSPALLPPILVLCNHCLV